MIKYNIDLSPEAKEGIAKFSNAGDKLALKKIDALLKELEDNPRTGTGHPEQLKGFIDAEIWSR